MKKISKVLLSSGMAACMMAGLFASPTATSTNNLFATDADKYMDVLDFSDVEFDKLFTNVNISSDRVSGGAAFNALGLYWGVDYNGNLIGATEKNNTTVVTEEKEGSNTEAGKVNITDKETTVKKSNKFDDWNSGNKFSILTGIGNLGIKTSLDQWGYKENSNGNGGEFTEVENNEIDAPKTITKQKIKNNQLIFIPAVEVGLPIELGDNTLALKSGLSVGFVTDTSKNNTESYKWYNNKQGDLVSTSTYNANVGYVSINPSFGAEFLNANFSYNGSFRLTGHNAKDANGKSIKTKGYYTAKNLRNNKTVNSAGVVETTDTTDTEYKAVNSYNSHDISLGYKNKKELNEKLSVAYGIHTNVNMNFKKTDSSIDKSEDNGWVNTFSNEIEKTVTKYDYTDAVANSKPAVYVTETTTIIKTTDNKVVSTTDVTVSPRLVLAAQYALKPTVKINFGYAAGGDLFNSKTVKTTLTSENPKTVTTTETKYSDGTVQNTKTVANVDSDKRTESCETTNKWNRISSSFYTGISFDLTENMTLDATMKFGKTGINNLMSAFNNVTIGATVKF